jgi:hypothetical protein
MNWRLIFSLGRLTVNGITIKLKILYLRFDQQRLFL